MIQTIVTPLDGSMHAQLALDLSIELAARYGARLVLLHVGVGNEDVPEELFNAVSRELREAESGGEETGIPPHPSQRVRVLGYMAKNLLHDACQLAKSKGVENADTIIDLGDAGERIGHHAKQTSADLIIMGSRGMGDLKGLVLGSVSHKVFHTAPCPCVTVHYKDGKPGPVAIKSVLAATDGSDQADRAVDLASDIAAKFGAKLTLEYVMWRGPSLENLRASVDMNQLSKDAYDDLDPEQHPIAEHVSSAVIPPVVSKGTLEEIGRQVLERGEQIATAKGVAEVELVLIKGDPARKIVQIAKREQADLVVLGSRGLGAAKSLFAGSVSYKINHTAPCSCMVVR